MMQEETALQSSSEHEPLVAKLGELCVLTAVRNVDRLLQFVSCMSKTSVSFVKCWIDDEQRHLIQFESAKAKEIVNTFVFGAGKRCRPDIPLRRNLKIVHDTGPQSRPRLRTYQIVSAGPNALASLKRKWMEGALDGADGHKVAQLTQLCQHLCCAHDHPHVAGFCGRAQVDDVHHAMLDSIAAVRSSADVEKVHRLLTDPLAHFKFQRVALSAVASPAIVAPHWSLVLHMFDRTGWYQLPLQLEARTTVHRMQFLSKDGSPPLPLGPRDDSILMHFIPRNGCLFFEGSAFFDASGGSSCRLTQGCTIGYRERLATGAVISFRLHIVTMSYLCGTSPYLEL
eukprot:TRINITY_DN1607_c0_g1_i11.p2 TRINITY_DN1607_c0_g1~~TRINITY_DN1607_c0_g1_i11.p2  ORF type:complete len:341 (+),score=45.79 TRINITY_DN1607_c0_g1_i11:2118-3140(+)